MAGDAAPLVVWSAGEASGDQHAAQVVSALSRLRPDVRSVGLGGPRMAAAGVELVASLHEVAAMGVTEVAARLPRVVMVFRRLERLLRSGRATLFVPVDYPGMNLRLAKRAAGAGVPVVYYSGPQVWAWGGRRLGVMHRVLRRMLVLFPFEVPIYEEAGIPVTWVGHPIVEETRGVAARSACRQALGIGADQRVLVLQPGSRAAERRRLLAPMLGAARRLQKHDSSLCVLVRAARGADRAAIRRAAEGAGVEAAVSAEADPRPVRAADLAVVASGTATLETGLLGTPMVIVYRVSALTWAIASRLVQIESVGLVNLVLGDRAAPELLQGELTVERLAGECRTLLDDPVARDRQRQQLARLPARMGEGGDPAERAAAAIARELDALGPGPVVATT